MATWNQRKAQYIANQEFYCDNTTVDWATNWSGTAASQMTFVPGVMAVTQASPDPVDDSPLAWLRRQVVEITELARAS